MQVTLKQLDALYWAATLGSFAQAAARLNMTQSALSKRIIDLELEIGEKLFDRSGPHARITDAGGEVLRKAEQMLALRDEILVGAHGPQSLRGTCRFGISEMMAMTALPQFVRRVREAYPDVNLEPRVAVTRELIRDMERGDTDFALCAGSSSDPGVESRLVKRVALVWCCAPDFLPETDSLTIEQLSNLNIISMSSLAGSTMTMNAWAGEHTIRFRHIVETNSPEAVAALTVAGLGVALLAEPFVDKFVASGDLRKLRIEPGPAIPDLLYFLHWRGDNQRMLPVAMRELALDVLQG